MIVKTGRFGQLSVSKNEIIQIPQGVLGFSEYKNFCLLDSGDETLILWLQSLENPELAFPLLEPKIFKSDYSVKLSAAELRELKLENVNQSAVLSILTIPDDPTRMTANLKAPLVINLKLQIAKQVVLQENEYPIKQEMFKELKMHLITIRSQYQTQREQSVRDGYSLISIEDIPPSLTVKSLQL